MSDQWDPERYRQRAEEWRQRAAEVPEGRTRRSYLEIAEGYERLADLLESQRQGRRTADQ
jgi:hypothetical protein